MEQILKKAIDGFPIISAVDETVIDVQSAKFEEGTKICSWYRNCTPAQSFKGNDEEFGFRIAAAGGKIFPEGLLVIDENSDGNVILSKFTSAKSQQWNVGIVDGTPFQFALVNAKSGNYLTYIGIGQQLKTLPKSGEDKQKWTTDIFVSDKQTAVLDCK